jgi:hypothetical protein
MTLSELRDRVSRDCAEALGSTNDRLTPERVTDALNDVYRDLAARAGVFIEQAVLAVVDGVSRYTRPTIMSEVKAVRLYLVEGGLQNTRLTNDTEAHLQMEHTDWRGTAKGIPERVIVRDGRYVEVWPAPDAALVSYLYLEGPVVPSTGAIGSPFTPTSSTDATPIVINKTAHGLVTGQWVTVAGHTTNLGANGTWRVTKIDANNFYLNDSVGSGAGAGGATGTVTPLGVPPLVEGTDVPQIPEQFHRMLKDGAVELLMTRYLLDSGEAAIARAAAAKRDYEEWIPALAAYVNGGGVGMSDLARMPERR